MGTISVAGLVGAFLAVVGGLVCLGSLAFGFIPGAVGGGLAVIVGALLKSRT